MWWRLHRCKQCSFLLWDGSRVSHMLDKHVPTKLHYYRLLFVTVFQNTHSVCILRGIAWTAFVMSENNLEESAPSIHHVCGIQRFNSSHGARQASTCPCWAITPALTCIFSKHTSPLMSLSEVALNSLYSPYRPWIGNLPASSLSSRYCMIL